MTRRQKIGKHVQFFEINQPIKWQRKCAWKSTSTPTGTLRWTFFIYTLFLFFIYQINITQNISIKVCIHKYIATEVAKICLNFYFCFYEIVLRRLCFLLFSSSYETFWNASGIFISSRAKIWMTQEFKGRVHKTNQSWQQKWGFLILCINSIFVPVLSYTNLFGYLFKSKLHIFQTLVSSFLLEPSLTRICILLK